MKFRPKLTAKNGAGMAIGFIFPILMIPIVVWALSALQHYPFSFLWNKIFVDWMILSKTLSLAIIPNLVWFYIFLNKERYEMAKGIIIGSAIHLPFIIYVNLIR